MARSRYNRKFDTDTDTDTDTDNESDAQRIMVC